MAREAHRWRCLGRSPGGRSTRGGTKSQVAYYSSSPDLHLTAVDLSPEVLQQAKARAPGNLDVDFDQADLCNLEASWRSTYDWVFSAFTFLDLSNEMQPVVLEEVNRVLKPKGKFRIMEVVHSRNRGTRWRQNLFSPRGARLNRRTLSLLS
jgi:ubiquinone/menaquinone biosynthesis C-methylase UbiE